MTWYAPWICFSYFSDLCHKKYVAARVKLQSKLREALKGLLSDERKFHLYAEPMLANLVRRSHSLVFMGELTIL